MVSEINPGEVQSKLSNYLKIKSDEIQKVYHISKYVVGEQNIKVISNNEIRIYNNFNQNRYLLDTLMSRGIPIDSFDTVTESLEEYYLKIVGDD